MKKIIIVAICLFIFLSVPCYAINQQDFNSGYQYGYDQGFKDATNQDTVQYYYNKGYDDGLKSAFNNSDNLVQDVYDKSYNLGYQDGYESGESSGKRIGRGESGDEIKNKEDEIKKLKSDTGWWEREYKQTVRDYNNLLIGFYIILTFTLTLLAFIAWTFIRKRSKLHRENPLRNEERKAQKNFCKEQIKMRLTSSPRKVNWLEFCIHWRYPVGAVLAIISIINSYSQIDLINAFATEPFIMTIGFMFDLLVVSTIILTAVNTRNLTVFGFKINRLLLMVEPIGFALNRALSDYSVNNWLGLFAIYFLIASTFSIANIVYFEHRKYLFDENAPYPCEVNNRFITDDKTKIAILKNILILAGVGIIVAVLIAFISPIAPTIPGMTSL